MKTRLLHTAVLILCSGLATTPLNAQSRVVRNRAADGNNDASANSNTDNIESVVLQIDSDPNANNGESRVDSQTIMALLKTTMLVDPALEKATGLSALEARKLITIEVQQAGYRFVQLSVSMRPSGATTQPAMGKSVINALCEQLKAVLEQSARAASAGSDARRASLEADLKSAQQRLDEANTQLKAARAASPSPNGDLRYQVQNLLQQKQQTELVLLSTRARLKSLTEEMPTTRASIPDASNGTTGGSARLSKLIELRTQRLEELKAKAEKNEATATDVAAAEALLDDARALAEVLSALPARYGSDRANSYAQAMTDLPGLRATIAENEARLTILNEQIKQASVNSDGPTIEQINRLQSDAQRRQNDVDNIQSQLSDTRRNRRVSTPVVTVLTGKPTTQE